jgi:D-arabinose 1-dehydrogenase-like Zn-dependent alcohol dehydrogenase
MSTFRSRAPGLVRVKVHACGVCHSDSLTVLGAMGNDFPRAPGHEVAGKVDAVGDGVSAWSSRDRVGVGWFGGCDFTCEVCRRGDFISCENGQVPGIAYDGGYAEYMVAPAEALARIPDDLSDVDAAPLLCAGITTFNALRQSVARPGDLVAILGVGGLGHLGVQYAAKMGFEVVAIARGEEKGPLAKELGAHHYIDSTTSDVADELNKLGGAQVVLATVTVPDAMTSALGGVKPRGRRRVPQPDAGAALRVDPRVDRGEGPRVRHVAGLGGRAALLGADRSAADDRDATAGRGPGRLRQDDERRRPLPHGPDDGLGAPHGHEDSAPCRGHGDDGARDTGPSDMLAPTAESRRELSTAADAWSSSRAGVSSRPVKTPAYSKEQRASRPARRVPAAARIRPGR